MTTLLNKLIAGATVTDRDLADALYEICDNTHASCDNNCPVFEANGNKVPDTANDFNKNCGCDTFKNGMAMLTFIRSKKKDTFVADMQALGMPIGRGSHLRKAKAR